MIQIHLLLVLLLELYIYYMYIIYFYIIKQDLFIYVLRIAGQTAGPIGQKYFVDTHGWLRGVIG